MKNKQNQAVMKNEEQKVTQWKRTTESFRGKQGEKMFKSGFKQHELEFISCTEALPPIGKMVLVSFGNPHRKLLKVALGVRTGLQLFATDEGRWQCYHDQHDGFNSESIWGWHPLPTAKLASCPDYK